MCARHILDVYIRCITRLRFLLSRGVSRIATRVAAAAARRSSARALMMSESVRVDDDDDDNDDMIGAASHGDLRRAAGRRRRDLCARPNSMRGFARSLRFRRLVFCLKFSASTHFMFRCKKFVSLQTRRVVFLLLCALNKKKLER